MLPASHRPPGTPARVDRRPHRAGLLTSGSTPLHVTFPDFSSGIKTCGLAGHSCGSSCRVGSAIGRAAPHSLLSSFSQRPNARGRLVRLGMGCNSHKGVSLFIKQGRGLGFKQGNNAAATYGCIISIRIGRCVQTKPCPSSKTRAARLVRQYARALKHRFP